MQRDCGRWSMRSAKAFEPRRVSVAAGAGEHHLWTAGSHPCVYLGTLAVAPYAYAPICAAAIGIAALGLSFLFPYLSGRMNALSSSELKATILKAFAGNLVVVDCCGRGLTGLWRSLD